MGSKTEKNANYSVFSTVCNGISYAVAHPVQAVVSFLAIQATVFGVLPAAARPITGRDTEAMKGCSNKVSYQYACTPPMSTGYYIKDLTQEGCWEGKDNGKPFRQENKAHEFIFSRGEELSQYTIKQFERNPNFSAHECAEMEHYQQLMIPNSKKPS
jgi:hypothetical protein